MRCPYCGLNFEDILNHYITHHNINSNNYLFKQLFEKVNNFFIKNCLRCDEILLNGIHEKEHNFLKHYQEGGSLPIELKPINRTILDRNLQKFSTKFDEHSDSYDFANGKKLPVEFLNVFNTKFNSSVDEKFIFKCLFIIINYQPPAVDIGAAICDSRFWSTKTDEGFFLMNLSKHL